MEPEDRLHEPDGEGNSLEGEVASLKEVISTGTEIMFDEIRARGGNDYPPKKAEKLVSLVEVLCARALGGDREALVGLRSIAGDVLSGAGSPDAVIGPKNRKRSSGRKLRKAAPAAKQRASSIDLSRLHELRDAVEFAGKFLGPTLPSVCDCADESEQCRVRATALLGCLAEATEGSSGRWVERYEPWVTNAILLEVEKAYVVSQRLVEIRGREEQHAQDQS